MLLTVVANIIFRKFYQVNVKPCEYRNISVCPETVQNSIFSILVTRSEIGDFVRVPVQKFYRQRHVSVTAATKYGRVSLDAQIDRVS